MHVHYDRLNASPLNLYSVTQLQGMHVSYCTRSYFFQSLHVGLKSKQLKLPQSGRDMNSKLSTQHHINTCMHTSCLTYIYMCMCLQSYKHAYSKNKQKVIWLFLPSHIIQFLVYFDIYIYIYIYTDFVQCISVEERSSSAMSLAMSRSRSRLVRACSQE